ncbi:MAG: hypothetical protein FJ088_03455 [Deltaproteobacteria bacterium]|nr:hypothetical protein [Deltaproteobacteria bacterium]
MLKRKVRNAVKNGKFNIYAVTEVDCALRILTGADPGQPDDKGQYPEGSIHGRVVKKLRRFNESKQNEKKNDK